jgi:glycosyltransferase involved in cell wall biosynthesis
LKVLLALHGYPPELMGGTEAAAQALARGLVAAGHEVLVAAGSMDHGPAFRTSSAVQPDGIRVVRFHRADLYFDHWQKSASAPVAAAFAALLAEERPDVLHVHHWIRMSRDLVAIAARAGVPAVVTLHDYWPTCLVTFRVRPDTQDACDADLAPDPCLDCAQLLPPRTPWLPRERQMLMLYERRADLVRELTLARAVVAPTRSHADSIARFLGLSPEALALVVLPHGRDLGLVRRTPERSDKLVLATWGNLHPLKGCDLILEALARLGRPEAVRLHVAGAEVFPEHSARLRELARGLDAVFHGPYAVADLAHHPVGGAHAMVSGSRARESFGMVLDEAAALGMPMILPRAGAFPERLPEGRGALYYAPRDAASLAEVLARLLADPGLPARLAASLPRPSELAPTEAQHVERLLAVYARAAAAGAPPVEPADWWEERLRNAEEAEWDQSLSRAAPEELGLR